MKIPEIDINNLEFSFAKIHPIDEVFFFFVNIYLLNELIQIAISGFNSMTDTNLYIRPRIVSF